MNEVLKIIYARRAVRKYNDKPLDRKIIEELLDAGRMAPSAINKQPWKFYILTKKEANETPRPRGSRYQQPNTVLC